MALTEAALKSATEKAPYPWLGEAFGELLAMRSRLPNAVLIHGAPGIGLFELGKAFAESLMCVSPNPDGTACGRCQGCRLTSAGTHPDLKFVLSEAAAAEHELPYEPAENERSSATKKLSREVRIHQVRALADFLGLSAHSGGRRAVLVYPADMVRAEAAAALLKSMEEPPADLIFILVAEDVDAVLPTIRSRSRMVRMPMPTKAEALDWFKKKRLKAGEEALAMAGGAPLAALRQGQTDRLTPKAEKTLVELLKKGQALTPDDIVRAHSADFTTPPVALLLARWTHDLLRVKAGVEPRYFTTEAAALQAVAATMTEASLWEFSAKVLGVRRAVEHPLNAKQVWEAILLAYRTACGAK